MACHPDEPLWRELLNVLSTAGASVLAIGYFLPLTYLIWSPEIPASSPEAQSLEMPPASNGKLSFATGACTISPEPPIVTQDPYRYDIGEPQAKVDLSIPVH